MRHHQKGRKFGRVRKVRTGFMRSLAVAFIRDEKIQTTIARAKELRPYIEKLITRGRNGDLLAIRLITSRLGGNPVAVKKLVNDISPRYVGWPGGYTRISKLGNREGDGAPMAVIELVSTTAKEISVPAA
ncbi:MAG: large subunit ribosomal protein L17 [Planctomycetota bacterium]|jgi:large subunit ribosomal protein L17